MLPSVLFASRDKSAPLTYVCYGRPRDNIDAAAFIAVARPQRLHYGRYEPRYCCFIERLMRHCQTWRHEIAMMLRGCHYRFAVIYHISYARR